MTAATLAARVNVGALAASIQSDLAAAPSGSTGAANLEILVRRIVDAVAAAVVAELQQNAVVAGAVTVTSVTGVTTGAGVSGPGIGSLAAGRIS